MDKKGAMELSVGTIVVIVLAMSMLILGLVLIRNIFSGGIEIVEITNDQIISEVNKLFTEEKKVVIYPSSDVIKVKQGDIGGFAIAISNKLSGASAQDAVFSYDVIPVSNYQEDCGVTEQEIMGLFSAGSNTDTGIPIATGNPKAIKVLFELGEGDPLCTIRFRVDVKANENNYDTNYVFVEFTG